MKGKGSRLAILLALVLTLVGAFGVTAFAADSTNSGAKVVNIQSRSAAGTRDVVECDIDYSGNVMTANYKAQELLKLDSSAAEGRPDNFAWIGMYVAAPENSINPRMSVTKSGEYDALDNKPEESDAFKAQHIWIRVNEDLIVDALKNNKGIINKTFYFDWNESGVANDTLKVNIDVNDVVLFEKNGTDRAITTEDGKVVHEHKWTATPVSDGKRTVTCSVNGCDYHDKGFEVGIRIADKTYDGEADVAETFTDEDLPEGINISFDGITYYHGNNDISENKLDGAPSKVNTREGENGIYLARSYVSVNDSVVGTVYKTFKINPAAIDVTADDITVQYGDPEKSKGKPTLTYTVDAAYKDKVVGALATNLVMSSAGWWQVGGYDITQGTLNTNDPNYKLNFTAGHITVNQAKNELTVSQEGWTEGESPKAPKFTYIYGSSERVVFTYYDSKMKEMAAPPDENTRAGQYYIQASMLGTKNYTAAQSEIEGFKIAKNNNPVKYKVAGWQYGNDATPTTAFEITNVPEGSSAEDFEIRDAEFKRKGTQYKEYSPWTEAGKTTEPNRYVVRATIHDKTGTYADKKNVIFDYFTVDKRDLIVDIDPAYKEYSEEDPASFNPTADKTTPLPDGVDIDKVVARVARQEGTTVGYYPFTITPVEGQDKFYNISANPNQFRIVPKGLSVKTVLDKNTWHYRSGNGKVSVVQTSGDALPAEANWDIEYWYRPANSTSEEDWEEYTENALIPVGEYTLRAEIDTTGSSYAIKKKSSVIECGFTVSPSNIIVVVDNYESVYKPDDGRETEDEIIDDVVIAPKDESKDAFDGAEVKALLDVAEMPSWDAVVGKYPVKLVKNTEAKESKNYSIEFVDGEYSINRRPLKLQAVDKEVTYGTLAEYSGLDDLVLAEEGKDKGFAHGETIDDLNGTVTYSYTGGYGQVTSPVGKYKVIPTGLTSGNYRIDLAHGTLTVNQKTINLTWTDNEEDLFDYIYNGSTHTITATTEDILSQDKSAVKLQFTDNVQKDVKRDESTWKVGSYWAKASLTDVKESANYKIKWDQVKQKFKIHPAELTLTPEDNTVVYGEEVVNKSFTGTGFIEGEDVSVVEGTPTFAYGEYVPGKPAGDSYAITFTNAFNSKDGMYAQNYQLKKSTGTLTVVAKPVSIQWDNTLGLVYDGTDQKPGCYVDNLVGSDSQPTLTIELKDGKGNVVTKAINAGDYTSKVTAVDSTNYTITGGENLTKQFSISPADVTVTADNKTVSYGDPVPKLTSKTSGVPSKGDEVKATLTTDYFQNAKAGAYTIKVTAGDNPNYNVKVVNGTLTVNDKVTTLVAQGKASGKKAVVVSWNSVTGAASYDVYLAKCNTKKKTYAPKYKGTTSGNSFKVKKLKKGTCYKYYVVAKAANGAVIAQSEVGHFIAGNVKGKKVNAKSITASTNVVSLNKGGSYALTTSQAKAKKGKKYKLLNGGHAPLTRYISSNPAVATVGYDNGVINAVGGGYCKVYAIAVNGMWSEVDVYVN